MSAIIKMYSDSACEHEIQTSGTVYNIFVGPEVGLDGDTGDQANAVIYIRNTGDKIAYNTKMVFNNNPGSMLKGKLAATDYTLNTIEIGTLNCADLYNEAPIVPVYLQFTVPTATVMTVDRPNVSFTYQSEA